MAFWGGFAIGIFITQVCFLLYLFTKKNNTSDDPKIIKDIVVREISITKELVVFKDVP